MVLTSWSDFEIKSWPKITTRPVLLPLCPLLSPALHMLTHYINSRNLLGWTTDDPQVLLVAWICTYIGITFILRLIISKLFSTFHLTYYKVYILILIDQMRKQVKVITWLT